MTPETIIDVDVLRVCATILRLGLFAAFAWGLLVFLRIAVEDR